MSPEAPCPNCGRMIDWSDQEMEPLEEGLLLCVHCMEEVMDNDSILGAVSNYKEEEEGEQKDQ